MGNIDSLRHRDHAKDYVRMQWMMLQQGVPDEFVIATGVKVTVREFIRRAALELGVTLRFEGLGVDETAVAASISGNKAPALKVGDVVVQVDPRYFRPAEVETLLGHPIMAKEKLGWVPEITLDELIEKTVAHDLDKTLQHAALRLALPFQ